MRDLEGMESMLMSLGRADFVLANRRLKIAVVVFDALVNCSSFRCKQMSCMNRSIPTQFKIYHSPRSQAHKPTPTDQSHPPPVP